MTQETVIHQDLLPYHDRLDARDPTSITLLVIHCTELPDLATARTFGEKIRYAESRTGNSGHYYIDRDGSVHQYVPDHRTAHHVSGHNLQSLGIELVNRGRYPDWHHGDHQLMDDAYPDAQIQALISLVSHLRSIHPSMQQVAGHEDLDRRLIPATNDPGLSIARKMDPGPLFPWSRFLQATGLSRIHHD